MKQYILSYAFLIYSIFCFAQKPFIDSSVYDKWPSVEGVNISNDGKYVSYTIKNQPIGSHTFILQATDNGWKMEMLKIDGAEFTQDSKKAVFVISKDSLGIITLGTAFIEYVPHISSYKLSKSNKDEWLAYQLSTEEHKLVLQNLKIGTQKNLTGIDEYWFSDDGKGLVLQTKSMKDSANMQSLKWLNLNDGDVIEFWKGKTASSIFFDTGRAQLAFISEDRVKSQTEVAIWHYKAGTDRAIRLVDSRFPSWDNDLLIDGIQGFNEEGSKIFFTLKNKKPLLKPRPDAVEVNVWSYRDSKLQSQQLKDVDNVSSFLAVINIQNHRSIRLEQERERVIKSAGDSAFIYYSAGDGGSGESNWNPAWLSTFYLISMKDGKKKQIKDLDTQSPGGRYEIHYNPKERNYFRYDVVSGITRNLTKGIKTKWMGYYWDDYPNSVNETRGLAGWLKDDEAVLIYDQHDIWQVDPTGRKSPINLTNGYGRKHNIIFYLGLHDYDAKIFSSNEHLILNAFNLNNKNNGFYSKVLGKGGDPELLTMGPYLYEIPNNPYVPDLCNFSPIKAKNAKSYILRRMSATESPNYFSTKDFKNFTRLTALHPEKDYNWYTTELHTWKALDGSIIQGILYKPENFDPNKKYPVIFNYYERKSDGLNAYLKPESLQSGCSINVPSFVSNGYLVFMPDIHFKVGETGESAVNAVVSAADYLSKQPFVDGKKMGIQGCSGGGFLTNYLVTHTGLFAAACSASGISDFISGYGSLAGDGSVLQTMYENTWWRMGKSLWQDPIRYIKNTTIFHADKVTTPFLIMHTTIDGVCPFPQAVELFTALRRLGKKVWMLEYTDGDHGVWGKSGSDFGIRLSQFFDHYLRGAAPPKWMTRGIPASMKGIDDGLELDYEIKTPGDGLLTNEEKKKVEALQHRGPITVTIE